MRALNISKQIALFLFFAAAGLAFFSFSPGFASATVKEVLTISSDSISPRRIILNQRDGSLFIHNDTESTEYRLEIIWNKRRLHCASDSLKVTENGDIVSALPLKPGDFEIVCFPDLGEYEIRVRKWDGGPVMKAVISVLNSKKSVT